MAYNLSNPRRIPCEFFFLSEKLKSMSMLLSWSNDKHESYRVGSVFHYIFGINKPHILDNSLARPVKIDHENETVYLKGTAATDGNNIFYSEDVLLYKSPLALLMYELHELNHIIYDHCNPMRTAGRNKKVWNWAVDYSANNKIEHGFRVIASKAYSSTSSNVESKEQKILKSFNRDINFKYPEDNHPLWDSEMNKPYYLDHLLSDLDKEVKKFLNQTEPQKDEKKEELPKDISHYKTKWFNENNESRIFVDYSVNHLTPEEIYDKIMEVIKPGQDHLDDLIEELNASCSSDHKIVDITHSNLLSQILSAQRFCQSKGIGKDPYGVSELVEKLTNPVLTAEQIIRNHVSTKYLENGQKNDWGRFRRRAISLDLYIPKKKDPRVTYLALLDTSGSMSQIDLSLGLSQLQALEGRAQGTLLCCDAQVYWEQSKPIKNSSDLEMFEAIGRGGTVFEEFFEDWDKHFSRDKYDFIVVMTDGGIFDLDRLKHPRKDVFWIITTGCDFHPPFGRVANLRNNNY
jgi:predicted metal-dependent peptidase